MIPFPGADSYRVTGMPSRSRTEARKSAALRVSPGGLELSIATYCFRSATASSALPDWLVAITEDTKGRTKDTKERTENTEAIHVPAPDDDFTALRVCLCVCLCMLVTFVAFVSSVLFLCVLVRI